MTYYVREYSRGDTVAPEIFQARGPSTLGATGAVQDLFSHNWHVRWEQNGNVVLAREDAGGWMDVQVLPLTLPDEARRVSLAFDQVAQPVIAWEESGQLWVWEIGSDTTRGPFTGRDPILLMDAEISGDIGGSDVCLFHLSLDRLTLQCRLQRTAYATPEDHYLYGNPVHLTRVVQHAVELEVQSTGESVLSSYYPIYATDSMTGDAAWTDAERVQLNLEHDSTESMIGAGIFAQADAQDLFNGSLTEGIAATGTWSTAERLQLELEASGTESMAGTGNFSASTLEDLFNGSLTENMTGAGNFISGSIDVAFIRTSTESMTGAGLFSDASAPNIGVPVTGSEALTGSGAFTGGTRA